MRSYQISKILWKQNLYNKNSGTDVDDLSDTMLSILDDILVNKNIINLQDVLTSEFNVEHLAAILRITYSMKYNVRYWDEALTLGKTFDPENNIFFALEGAHADLMQD